MQSGVLSPGGRKRGEGHARPDPRSPVSEGRTGEFVEPETSIRRARKAHGQCRGSPQAAQSPLPCNAFMPADTSAASTKTYDIEVWMPASTVMSRSRRARISWTTSPPRPHPLPQGQGRKGGFSAHAQRFGPCRGQDTRRGHGELPDRGKAASRCRPSSSRTSDDRAVSPGDRPYRGASRDIAFARHRQILPPRGRIPLREERTPVSRICWRTGRARSACSRPARSEAKGMTCFSARAAAQAR